jgi:hypothetical protein
MMETRTGTLLRLFFKRVPSWSAHDANVRPTQEGDCIIPVREKELHLTEEALCHHNLLMNPGGPGQKERKRPEVFTPRGMAL